MGWSDAADNQPQRRLTELDEALQLANKMLDRPGADPDDDLAMLSRQLIRQNETAEALRKQVAQHEAAASLGPKRGGCIWCGTEFYGEALTPERMRRHQLECPKHPIAALVKPLKGLLVFSEDAVAMPSTTLGRLHSEARAALALVQP